MALSGFLVPFATGALTKAQDIRDEQDEISGAMIDESSKHWRSKFEAERERIKKKKELYSEIENGWGKSIAEVMSHLGFLDDGNTEKAYAWLKEIGPENIAKFKNLKPEDYKSVFLENADRITKSIESKENVLAKNSNREGLKSMSDLFFGDTIRKKGGKLDTARQFLFGGPILREKDIEASRLQLAKEIKAEDPTLEPPDEALLKTFEDLELGPISLGDGGTTHGVSDSEVRLRGNIASDVALASVGLSNKYKRLEGGNVQFIDFSDADHTLYTAANVLVSRAFNVKGFDINQYREIGALVGKYLNKNQVLANNQYQKFINDATKIQLKDKTFRVDPIINITKENPSGEFNKTGYDYWLLQNAQMVAAYMADDALRPMFRIKFGGGAYLAYFNKLDEEIAATASGD